MKWFISVGIILLIILTYLIVSTTTTNSWNRPTPKIFDKTIGFSGGTGNDLLKAEIKSGKEAMNKLNDKGNLLSFLSDITIWCSFTITSIITIIIGYYKKSFDGQNIPELIDKTKKLNKTMKVLGVLAALATVTTGLGDKFSNSATEAYERCDVIHQQIKNARDAVALADDENEKSEIIEELRIVIDRSK